MKEGASDRVSRLFERCSNIRGLELDLSVSPPYVLEFIIPLFGRVPVKKLEVHTLLFDQIIR